jgi:tripartite-type tricarboxylate transporter receptor subunit TctC
MGLPRRRFLHLAAAAAAPPIISRSAWAQGYPTRPVRIVVGFAAGSAFDILARLIGQRFLERLGQPFVVENCTGAAGASRPKRWCGRQPRRADAPSTNRSPT